MNRRTLYFTGRVAAILAAGTGIAWVLTREPEPVVLQHFEAYGTKTEFLDYNGDGEPDERVDSYLTDDGERVVTRIRMINELPVSASTEVYRDGRLVSRDP